ASFSKSCHGCYQFKNHKRRGKTGQIRYLQSIGCGNVARRSSHSKRDEHDAGECGRFSGRRLLHYYAELRSFKFYKKRLLEYRDRDAEMQKTKARRSNLLRAFVFLKK